MKSEKKIGRSFWLSPEVYSRMDSWLEADNCKSRSEFVEKALRFYMGYLATEDVSQYLSRALIVAIEGELEDNSNRLRSLLFKWAVELDMLCHVVSAHFGADEIDRRELRKFAVEEVKRTNGQISFSHALDVQRQLPDEEEDGAWPE